MLEGESKVQMEELTMELCRTRLSEEKAAKTTEKLQKKRDSTWGKVGTAGVGDGCVVQATCVGVPYCKPLALICCGR